MGTLTYAVDGKVVATSTMVTVECYKCHVVFAMPEFLNRQCHDTGKEFFCPQGHGQVYQETEVEKLKKKLQRAEDNMEYWKEQERYKEQRLGMERRSHAATKGQLTKVKKRVANGICPCCHRHFVDLERHMTGQHPGYAEKAE